MAEERVQRRLAAILAADVVGYSRLIEADEEGTRARLRRLQSELIEPRIAADGGRIVKTMGDGILAEFPSAVDAVRNALAIQSSIAGRNAELPEDQCLIFRVGVNVGDVIVEGDDIQGDGVNVAARIEGLGEPGGVFVSGSVFEQVTGKLDASFDDLGEQTVKNMARPVHVYRARLGSKAKNVSAPVGDYASRPGSGDDVAVDVSTPVEGFQGRAAIAVLPFDNLSGDPEQEFFADGITEDVITRLSLWQWFPVIARNSTFVFKEASIDVKEVGEKLGARYVVEGSVKKFGSRVRVTSQLIDCATGYHLWAERYDRDLEDIFAIQDEITQSIVGAIEPALGAAEQRRAHLITHDNLDAWEASQRAFWHYNKATREDLELAAEWFRKSIAIDPHHPLAPGGLSMTIMRQVIRQWVDDFDSAVREMQENGLKAIRIDERAARGHVGLGWSRLVTGQHDFALDSLERAVEVNPSFGQGYTYLGLTQMFCGLSEEARASADTAMRLSPQDPMMPWMLDCKGLAFFVDRDYSAAVRHFNRAAELAPEDPITSNNLAAALGHMGRIDDARKHLEVVQRHMPNMSLEMLQRTYPFKNRENFDLVLQGLNLIDANAVGS
jgi:TolB-like protein/class 3 adenylate cyclase/Tfp pilus assembly protein PilF